MFLVHIYLFLGRLNLPSKLQVKSLNTCQRLPDKVGHSSAINSSCLGLVFFFSNNKSRSTSWFDVLVSCRNSKAKQGTITTPLPPHTQTKHQITYTENTHYFINFIVCVCLFVYLFSQS